MGAGGGFHADHEGIQRLSNTLRTSTEAMDGAAQAPPSGADAGSSTAQVEHMISQLTKAASGLRGGTEDAANNVADSGATYRRSDQASKDGLSGNGEQAGGH